MLDFPPGTDFHARLTLRLSSVESVNASICSTFGSAAGTLLTSFYLVLYLEVNQILLLMLLISAAVAAAVWLRPARVRAG